MSHPSRKTFSAIEPEMKKGRRATHHCMHLSAVVLIMFLRPPSALALDMLADITTNTVTEFGTYQPLLVTVTPSAAGYTIAPDFSNVVNFNQFTFTDAQKNLLRRNGFVAMPQKFPVSWWGTAPLGEMFDVYNYAREEELPIFVTVDALLHTYHRAL